jgi:hypothetical protein
MTVLEVLEQARERYRSAPFKPTAAHVVGYVEGCDETHRAAYQLLLDEVNRSGISLLDAPRSEMLTMFNRAINQAMKATNREENHS